MEAAVRAYQNVTQKEFRDQLIVEHLEAVRHVLGRIVNGLPGFVDTENLESAGVLGLVEAASQFDPARGVEFRTFAYHRIRGAILDELRRNCPLPQPVLQLWTRIRQVWEQMGEKASATLVALMCGITEEELDECIAAVRLAQPETWHDELAGWRQHSASLHDPAAGLNAADEQKLLADAIEQLPERQRIVLSLYYTEELRLAEIGEVLGVSESRVSRLLSQSQLQIKTILERKLAQ